jgi:hypothetical protein
MLSGKSNLSEEQAQWLIDEFKTHAIMNKPIDKKVVEQTVKEFQEQAKKIFPTDEEIYRAYGLNPNLPYIHLNGWQTVQDYAKQQGVNPQNVYNWLARNNSKLDSIRVKELNNLLLVKNKEQSK